MLVRSGNSSESLPGPEAVHAFIKEEQYGGMIACASSVGPVAANMVTACATATVNGIPLLVFPADAFASRQPDLVLQQLERSDSLAASTNDAFKPVCKYWDQVSPARSRS